MSQTRAHTKWQLGFLLLLSAALFQTSCNLPPAPVAPTWETDFSLPLISKSYNILDEVVSTTDELTVDSLNNLYFEFESEIDTISVGDQLQIDGLTESVSQSLGRFSIPATEEKTIGVTLREIFPQADQMNGMTAPVPPFQFNLDNKQIDGIESFHWAEIQSGLIRIKVVNNLPIDLGKPTNLELVEVTTGAVIARVEVPDFIAKNGGEFITFLDLSGKRLTNQLSINLDGGSPGSANPVEIDADAGFRVEVGIENLVVIEAAAKIGQQHLAKRDQFVLPDSVVVESAKLKDGRIDITISGSFPVDTEIQIKVPNFVNANTETLAIAIPSLQSASMPIRIDLAGYQFKPEGRGFGDQKITLDWEINTLQPEDQITILRATDYVTVDVEMSDLTFEEIAGKFSNKRIEIPSQTLAVDIPEDLQGIGFEDASLTLTLYNTINIPVRTDLKITGKNETGQAVTMQIQSMINAGRPNGIPVPTVIEINRQTNSTIVDLLNLLPKSIEVTGQADIGQSDQMGRVRSNDKVSGTIKFRAPLAFKLPPQEIEVDARKIEIDSDVQQRLRDNLLSGTLFARVNSHLPVGATIELFFAENDSAVYDNPPVKLGPVVLNSGQIDPQSGDVTGAALSEIELSLEKSQIEFFARDVVYSGVKISLPGTDDQFVRLKATDYVEVKAYAQFKVKVDKDALRSN